MEKSLSSRESPGASATHQLAVEDHPPLVSIVIPTFNHVHFLGEAIASAKAQTVGGIEIVVVDDGSTDNPGAVVSKFSDVALIRQSNQGLAAARNTGWRAAHGRYIVFLDADDRLLPNALATNLASFRGRPECAFVYGAYRLFYDDGRPTRLAVAEELGSDPYERLLRGNVVGMHATVMYRRDALAAAGGFDPGLRACEDYDLMLRLAREHPVVRSEQPVAEYRRHADNMSRKIPLMLSTALQVLQRQHRFAQRRPAWRRAYREGLDFWRDHYCEEMTTSVITSLRQRRRIGITMLVDLARIFAMAPFASVRDWVRRAVRILRRMIWGRDVRFGSLRRTRPFSRSFGYGRGRPIDRRYIERFLHDHAADIRGHVLEVGDAAYTRAFGGENVTRSDVLHVSESAPEATIIGDLSNGDDLPSEAFDCIILTQTLHLLYDLRMAVRTLHRMLKPGGVLLLTVPGVSAIDHGEWGPSWHWSFTGTSLGKLLRDQFGADAVQVSQFGNVLAAVAFLHGLAQSELTAGELDDTDPHFPVIVAARAQKSALPDRVQS